jgi:hypothetical protein
MAAPKDPLKVLTEQEQISQSLVNNLPFVIAFFRCLFCRHVVVVLVVVIGFFFSLMLMMLLLMLFPVSSEQSPDVMAFFTLLLVLFYCIHVYKYIHIFMEKCIHIYMYIHINLCI